MQESKYSESHLIYAKMFAYEKASMDADVKFSLETMNYNLGHFQWSPLYNHVIKSILRNYTGLGYGRFNGERILHEVILRYEEQLGASKKSLLSKHVFIGNGTSELLLKIIQSILSVESKRNQFIIAGPAYCLFSSQIMAAGGRAKIVLGCADEGFSIDVSSIAAAIGVETCAIVVTNPSNPAGASMSPEALQSLHTLALSFDLWVISDEVYAEMYAPGAIHTSILCDGQKLPPNEKAIRLFGPSKDRPGFNAFRIGYALVPDSLALEMTDRYLLSNFSISVVQQALLIADIALRVKNPYPFLEDLVGGWPSEVRDAHLGAIDFNMRLIDDLRIAVCDHLVSLPSVDRVIRPTAGNTVMFRLHGVGSGDGFFFDALRAGLFLYPGDLFHAPFNERWSRVCLTREPAQIHEAIAKIPGISGSGGSR